MKVFVLMLSLVSSTFVSAAYSQTSKVDVVPVVPRLEMKNGPQPIPEVPGIDPASAKYMEDLNTRVFRNWEPGSTPMSKTARVTFKISPNGSFEHIALARSCGNPQIDLACVDAVAQCDGFRKRVPSQISESPLVEINFAEKFKQSKLDCVNNFLSMHPQLKRDNLLVWHVVPNESLESIRGLPKQFVHCNQNLRVIGTAYVNSQMLVEARREWSTFLHENHNLSEKQLREKSQSMEQKYSAMFETGGTGNPDTTRR